MPVKQETRLTTTSGWTASTTASTSEIPDKIKLASSDLEYQKKITLTSNVGGMHNAVAIFEIVEHARDQTARTFGRSVDSEQKERAS